MKIKLVCIFITIGISFSSSYAEPPSSFLIGVNQYNDDPSGVIGDFQRFVGNVSGTNVNLWWRKFLSKSTFFRTGLSLDLGGCDFKLRLGHFWA